MLGAEGLVNAFVAEHVWEHLSLPDAHRATRNCERHLRPGGRLRIAVPNPAWYFPPAGSSSILCDEDEAFTRRGHNRTALPSQTEGSTVSDVGKDESTGGSGVRDGGDSCGGGSGDWSEEWWSSIEVTSAHEEVRGAGRTTAPAGLGLPGWLSPEMLKADARDRHLVQYTPELLANLCWSAGLIPFLLEGGEANEEDAISGEQGAAATVAEAAHESGDEEAEAANAVGSDQERRENSPRHQNAPLPLARFPAVDKDATEEWQQDHLWGHIKRSGAGGDPRGAVSIVMDCVKPAVGKDDMKDHPESFEAGHVTEDQPARHGAEGHKTNLQQSQDLVLSEEEPSSPRHSVPSQQRLSVSDNSLAHTETFHNPIEADRTEGGRGSFAAGVAGITSGIGHGSGNDDSIASGIVALGKGAAADTLAVAIHLDGGYDSTSIVVRSVASRPREHNKNNHQAVIDNTINRAGGHEHAYGGVGMGTGTAIGSCRGLLCDGGGQSGDAAGSGEGG